MDEKALFLKIWDREAPAMRKVIARIPQDRSDYRADPKARTAREIAWLLVREEILLADGLEKGEARMGRCADAGHRGGDSRHLRSPA